MTLSEGEISPQRQTGGAWLYFRTFGPSNRVSVHQSIIVNKLVIFCHALLLAAATVTFFTAAVAYSFDIIEILPCYSLGEIKREGTPTHLPSQFLETQPVEVWSV